MNFPGHIAKVPVIARGVVRPEAISCFEQERECFVLKNASRSHLKSAAAPSIRLHGLFICPRRWTTSRRLIRRDRSAELTTKPRSPQSWQCVGHIYTMISPCPASPRACSIVV